MCFSPRPIESEQPHGPPPVQPKGPDHGTRGNGAMADSRTMIDYSNPIQSVVPLTPTPLVSKSKDFTPMYNLCPQDTSPVFPGLATV